MKNSLAYLVGRYNAAIVVAVNFEVVGLAPDFSEKKKR
jgi:hypothetical protein